MDERAEFLLALQTMQTYLEKNWHEITPNKVRLALVALNDVWLKLERRAGRK